MSEFKAVRSLRFRYAIGLGAIAVLVTTSWLSLQQIVEKQNSFAEVVNIAGHQGGNAERIALFSLSMLQAANEDEFDVARAQLGRTINTMRRRHHTLLEGNPEDGVPKIMTPMLELIYFDPASGLDKAVERYLSNAETVYGVPYGELDGTNGAFVYVMQYGPHVIKSLFDSAVEEYEAEGKRSIAWIQEIELWVWVTALAALALEALFIFRPLEKKIADALTELGEKNMTLRDTISKMTAARLGQRESEERFRDMAENVPGVIFRLVERADGERYYEYVSPRALEFCGVPAEELRRDWRAMNLHPDDVEQFLSSIQDAHVNRHGWSFEGRVMTPDGGEKWWRSVSKPVSVDDEQAVFNGVMFDITQQKEMEDELRKLATTDPLTGAYNRRCFLSLAEEEICRSRRHNRPLTVLMLDIDHFKAINDNYGHAGGDEALKRVVETIRTLLRVNDVLGRFGGEEFAVLMPETGIAGAMTLAERIRVAIAALKVTWEDKSFQFTVSIGAARYKEGDGIDVSLNAADLALYRAKTTGRNRTISADDLEPPSETGVAEHAVH